MQNYCKIFIKIQYNYHVVAPAMVGSQFTAILINITAIFMLHCFFFFQFSTVMVIVIIVIQ